MQTHSIYKYARMSPRKVRDVAREIQGRNAAEALQLLPLIPRKAAGLIEKTLRSAVANAETQHNIAAEELTVRSVVVGEGPALRRFRPAARGSAHPYRKRTSHIRVVVSDEPVSTPAND
jgi:large subunit ribosomal protein L22